MLFHAAHLPSVSPTGGSVSQAIRKFVEAEDLLEVLDTFQAWKDACLELEKGLQKSPGVTQKEPSLAAPVNPFEIYSLLRKHSFRATHHLTDFWKCIEARFADPRHKCDDDSDASVEKSSALAGRRALIVGGGPAGLRAAIELALQKFESVVVLEKRDTFSRVNVMRIHAEDMDELVKEFGARDFYRKICIQDRDVVAIRRLQLILTKMALCLGVDVHAGSELTSIRSELKSPYWTATTNNIYPEQISVTYNTLILATGEKSTLSSDFAFSRVVFRAGNATGITCNFYPSHTPIASSDAMQGGRVSYLNAPFFNALKEKGLELENIASYVTEESHYIVMTPKKATLLAKGVLKEDIADPVELVHHDNVDRDQLIRFAREVATEVGVPSDNDFLPMRASKDGPTWPDVGIFDFTGKTMATEPSKTITETFQLNGQSYQKSLLVALVGDALVEPFWPTGTGWARANGSCKLLGDVIRELGSNPLHWHQHAEEVLKFHEDQYVRLKSESYAPMTRVMGVA
ncbi:hypothetical protein PhCBS80983_g05518 [Powellomyces hirtus]|uniref:Uncharacterized protein n=1 Tax=Powellomyces hirtus TaxID=109895 RepID=A0A507DTZ7_9FUNG|nr:hypothetical protein PhCBS80983_g05518 [Powellomyces hirtus]